MGQQKSYVNQEGSILKAQTLIESWWNRNKWQLDWPIRRVHGQISHRKPHYLHPGEKKIWVNE